MVFGIMVTTLQVCLEVFTGLYAYSEDREEYNLVCLIIWTNMHHHNHYYIIIYHCSMTIAKNWTYGRMNPSSQVLLMHIYV